ncbi:hypothetical protein [Micromonospora sp. SH-82]|uniref:hypothetical protein n=1 Tax=Micromonospora sp. SH-82 TaxID=3132938 RepID=UPI003EBF2ECA
MSSSIGSDRRDAVPAGVTDTMLWRQAIVVAEQHRDAAQGQCRNLQCADGPQPCAAYTWARRALQLAYPAEQEQQHADRPALAAVAAPPRYPGSVAAA